MCESNTPPEIFKHHFYELYHELKNYYRIFTDGSKEGNRVAAAVVHRDNTECVLLPDTVGETGAKWTPFCIFSHISGNLYAMNANDSSKCAENYELLNCVTYMQLFYNPMLL